MTCLLLLTALAAFCGSCQAATDCYTMVGRTAVYSGTTSVTTNNHTCQDWSSQSPNGHGYIDSYFSITNGDAGPGHAGASNYCRDPWGGSKRPSGYLWCYVASGNPRWERCDVPKCPDTTTVAATTTASVTTTAAATTVSATTAGTTTTAVTTTASATTTAAATTTGASAADCYTIVGRTAVYSGTTSVTTNNHTCQDWSSQSPNGHGYIDSYFSITNGDAGPGHAGASNYCRDPWGGSKRPSGYLWCYVASGNPRWEKCDVPKCPDTTTAVASTTTSVTTTAAATTASATTAGTTTTAVTTTASATTTVAATTTGASASDCYTIVDRTAVYSGTTSVTTNNHTCQDWSSQSPNGHGYIDSYFSITNGDAGPGHAGASNYCRDPWGGSKRPSGYLWCYVASGNPRWERCDVSKCPDTTTVAATTTASVTTTAAASTVSATTAGTTTTAVTTTASATTTAAATTTGASASDCYTIVDRTAVYSGTTSVTTNNHTCQDWSSQSPNGHGYIDSYFSITNGDAGPGHAGASNYCRDPWGGSKRPSGYLWCYVASGNPRWEKCDVPKCPDTTTAAATTAGTTAI